MVKSNDEEEEYPLARRALNPGESVFRPPDGSPAIILKRGQLPPPKYREAPPPPPPPIYDGVVWTPPVQTWDIKAAIKRCDVVGCTEPRAAGTTSVLCRRHRAVKGALGDPLAIRIPKSLVKKYARMAKRFMSRHSKDQNVQEALSVLRAMLAIDAEGPPQYLKPSPKNGNKRGALNPEYALWRELRRCARPPMVADRRGLKRGGKFPVKPDPRGPLTVEEALTSVIAWWLFLNMQQLRTLDPVTVDARNVVLGRAILSLRKRGTTGNNPKRFNVQAMRLLGEKIAGRNERPGQLARFLGSVLATVRADEQERAAKREAKREAARKEQVAPVESPAAPAVQAPTEVDASAFKRWLEAKSATPPPPAVAPPTRPATPIVDGRVIHINPNAKSRKEREADARRLHQQ